MPSFDFMLMSTYIVVTQKQSVGMDREGNKLVRWWTGWNRMSAWVCVMDTNWCRDGRNGTECLRECVWWIQTGAGMGGMEQNVCMRGGMDTNWYRDGWNGTECLVGWIWGVRGRVGMEWDQNPIPVQSC